MIEAPSSGSYRRHVATSALTLAAATATAWFVGSKMAGTQDTTVLVVLTALATGCTLFAVAAPRMPPATLAVEVPLVLLLSSTLVFRTRSLDEITYNPLDPAAQLRVVCLGLAGLLGGIAFITRGAADRATPLTSRPFRVYAAYVIVVFMGAFLSANVTWTLYRGLELLVAIVVLGGAYRAAGARASQRIESVLFAWVVILVASIWIGVVLFPDRAISHLLRESAPMGWNLTGVYPTFSANGVGTLGVVLATWSIARLASGTLPRNQRRLHMLLAGAGFVTLAAAQYRTGYVAFVVAMLVLLIVKRMFRLTTIAVLLAALILTAVPSLPQTAEPHLLRGQTPEEARELSSRVEWWSLAIPVWRESPVIGRGLLTASRVEALGEGGFGDVSSIHSTWVEALVGTGIAGVSLLAVFLAMVLVRGWQAARPPRLNTAPLLLIVVIMVRSVTGKTFEAVGFECLLLLSLALALPNRPTGAMRFQARAPDPEDLALGTRESADEQPWPRRASPV